MKETLLGVWKCLFLHGTWRCLFLVCPNICLVVAPKIGMNRRGIVLSSSRCNSSRFSGPCTRSYVKGIPKKIFPCSSYAAFLRKSAYHELILNNCVSLKKPSRVENILQVDLHRYCDHRLEALPIPLWEGGDRMLRPAQRQRACSCQGIAQG